MDKNNAPADALDPFTERRACAVVRLLLERDGIEGRLLEVRLDQYERVLGHHNLIERHQLLDEALKVRHLTLGAFLPRQVGLRVLHCNCVRCHVCNLHIQLEHRLISYLAETTVHQHTFFQHDFIKILCNLRVHNGKDDFERPPT